MKLLLSLSLFLLLSNHLNAQINKDVLDSLRYYPDFHYAGFASIDESVYNGITYYSGSSFEYHKINNYYYGLGLVEFHPDDIDSTHAIGIHYPTYDCGVFTYSLFYERVDSTKGEVIRWIKNNEYWDSGWENPMNLFLPDSTEMVVDKVFFEEKPQVGDTILYGSSRFLIFQNKNFYDDSINVNNFVVIYKGYREVTDSELEFDNPVDTLFSLLDFEIRDTSSNLSLIHYTLAKDIGLFEFKNLENINNPNRPYPFPHDTYKLYNFSDGERQLTRNHLFVSNQDQIELPSEIKISAYPNPFNPSTTISYTISQSDKVKIKIFNQLGQKITTLENSFKQAGNYTVDFNATNLASGMYLIRLETGKEVQTAKVMLVK